MIAVKDDMLKWGDAEEHISKFQEDYDGEMMLA